MLVMSGGGECGAGVGGRQMIHILYAQNVRRLFSESFFSALDFCGMVMRGLCGGNVVRPFG